MTRPYLRKRLAHQWGKSIRRQHVMKKNQKVVRNLNAFLKHTKGKCPIVAYTVPLVPAVKCIIENRLASGIGYYQGFAGQEVGDWFRGTNKETRTGPGDPARLGPLGMA